MTQPSEYAQAGVDYKKIQPFKEAMIRVGKQTVTFPTSRGVTVHTDLMHSHGAVFEVGGLMFCQTQEGLGNKNWIAEWMYQFAGTGRTYYEGIGIDAVMMAANDNIAQGAQPIIFTDEVAAGQDSWFEDKKRAAVLGQSFRRGCELAHCALPAGESPALKYLINALPPVTSAPSLSGCVLGIINPISQLITGEKLSPGDAIIGVRSTGIHANGISLVIKRAMELPDQFLTKLPNGNTLGEEALIPTCSYVDLVRWLQLHEVPVHAILPGTGDGVAKLSFDKRPFTYRVHSWLKEDEIPILFRFMRSLGVSILDCLTTFNWGIGYYLFVPQDQVNDAIVLGTDMGNELMEVGVVEEGRRGTIFEPEGGLFLPPPGE